MYYVYILFFVVLIFIFFAWGIFFLSLIFNFLRKRESPFVPIEKKYLHEILKISSLTKDDVFCDLGSGDGRVLIEAVKNFNLKSAWGVESNFLLFLFSKAIVRHKGLGEKIKVFYGDFFNFSDDFYRQVTVFYVYLLPVVVERLYKRYFSRVNKKTKIICVSFGLKNYEKDFKLLEEKRVGWHTVYIYEKI